MITHWGIEVNPNQIKAINNLHPPHNPKEVQKLIGMMVALNRFISRLANRCWPFFQLLHKWKNFEWTKECIDAFKELKSTCLILLFSFDPRRRRSYMFI